MTAFFNLLQSVPLLGRLNADQLAAVEALCIRCSYTSGQEIVREGTTGDGAYVLIDGPVECLSSVGGEAVATPVPAGSTVLELAMIIDIETSATCIARGPTKVLKIPRAGLHALMERDMALRDGIIESLTIRLADMAATMREASQIFDDFRQSA